MIIDGIKLVKITSVDKITFAKWDFYSLTNDCMQFHCFEAVQQSKENRQLNSEEPNFRFKLG